MCKTDNEVFHHSDYERFIEPPIFQLRDDLVVLSCRPTTTGRALLDIFLDATTEDIILEDSSPCETEMTGSYESFTEEIYFPVEDASFARNAIRKYMDHNSGSLRQHEVTKKVTDDRGDQIHVPQYVMITNKDTEEQDKKVLTHYDVCYQMVEELADLREITRSQTA